MNDYLETTDFHKQLLSERQEKILEDQRNLAIDKVLKKQAFLQANQVLVDEKMRTKQNESNLEKMEKLDYFPFTHGDLIENQRKVLSELQLQEIQRAIREKQAQNDRQRR